jgi:hypothetical protein
MLFRQTTMGLNDIFHLNGYNIDKVDLFIYDRWGIKNLKPCKFHTPMAGMVITRGVIAH